MFTQLYRQKYSSRKVIGQNTSSRFHKKSPFENVETFSSNAANVCLLKMTRVKDMKGTSSRQVQKKWPSNNLWQIILLTWQANIYGTRFCLAIKDAPLLIELLFFWAPHAVQNVDREQWYARVMLIAYLKSERYPFHIGRQFLSVPISLVECQTF